MHQRTIIYGGCISLILRFLKSHDILSDLKVTIGPGLETI